MAVPDNTARARPFDHDGRMIPMTESPDDGLLWRSSQWKGKRRPPPPPEDLYVLAIKAIQSVLKLNREMRLEPCLGERGFDGPLPFDAAQCYGLNAALYLLYRYVGTRGLQLGS